jgi:hypothetical protein
VQHAINITNNNNTTTTTATTTTTTTTNNNNNLHIRSDKYPTLTPTYIQDTKMPSQPLTDTEKQLIDAYNTILEKPFVDKYEDRWEDEPFDRAIDLFKSRAQEIGFADPFELLSKFKIESYETVRAQHKKGPALCFRQGWKSPILGTRVDPLVIASKCEHLAGPQFTGQERIVVLDFWASW